NLPQIGAAHVRRTRASRAASRANGILASIRRKALSNGRLYRRVGLTWSLEWQTERWPLTALSPVPLFLGEDSFTERPADDPIGRSGIVRRVLARMRAGDIEADRP